MAFAVPIRLSVRLVAGLAATGIALGVALPSAADEPKKRTAAMKAEKAVSRQAHAAYERGDFLSAFRSWRGLARQGNGLAAYRLGRLYRSGKGVAANNRRALRWFHVAARSRIAAAHYQIGLMHLTGDHATRDIAEAWARLQVAARMGHAGALTVIGYVRARMTSLEMWRARLRAKELWPKPAQAAR